MNQIKQRDRRKRSRGRRTTRCPEGCLRTGKQEILGAEYAATLAQILDDTSVVIARLLRNGAVDFMNEGAQRLTGRPREYYMGKRIMELTVHPPAILAGCEEVFQSVVETGKRFDYEFSVRRFDGTRYFLVTFIPEADHNSEVKSVTALGQDISHHRETQESLRESDLRKERFLAILGHELRNPLATLRSGLRILQMSSDQSQAEQVREMMERQLSHIIRLVNDLLDISRISRGRLSLVKSQIILSDIINLALESSEDAIRKSKHSLKVTLPEKPIELSGDLNRLAQVVTNLLENAAKYTPEGGAIALEVVSRGDVIEVKIADNGIGIPLEEQERVFHVFTQVEQEHSRSRGGLGVGLFLVKVIVEAHGGSVRVQSEGSNKGTTFSLTLPVHGTGDTA